MLLWPRDRPHFVHVSTDEHLGGFHLLAILHGALLEVLGEHVSVPWKWTCLWHCFSKESIFGATHQNNKAKWWEVGIYFRTVWKGGVGNESMPKYRLSELSISNQDVSVGFSTLFILLEICALKVLFSNILRLTQSNFILRFPVATSKK